MDRARSTPTAVDEALSSDSPRAASATRAQIERRIYEWTSAMRFRLVLDGNHPSGVSYTALLEYLADGGRDFTQPTVQLRQTVAPVILDVIERRFERRNGDIRVQPRSASYVRQLRREGRAGQPVGVRTGALRARISRARAREVVFE